MDLYNVEVDTAEFKRCGGNIGGSLESCALTAEFQGGMAIQDTKRPGPELRFNDAELESLADRINAHLGRG